MDDIDRKLAAMADKQVRCPKCGETSFLVLYPEWAVAAARSNIDGTIAVGPVEQYVEQTDKKIHFECYDTRCGHVWENPGVDFVSEGRMSTATLDRTTGFAANEGDDVQATNPNVIG